MRSIPWQFNRLAKACIGAPWMCVGTWVSMNCRRACVRCCVCCLPSLRTTHPFLWCCVALWCCLLLPIRFRPSNTKHKIVFVWFGCLQSTRGNHTSRMGRVSNYLVTGNVRNPTKMMFPIFALLPRLRFFFFVPRNPRFHLLKKKQKMRAGQ